MHPARFRLVIRQAVKVKKRLRAAIVQSDFDLARAQLGAGKIQGRLVAQRLPGRGQPANGSRNIAFEELERIFEHPRDTQQTFRLIRGASLP